MTVPGLPAGRRWRCAACGNLTRFDVETTERVRRYWHAELSGEGRVEREQRLEVTVERVSCRWCGSTDAIEDVEAPGGVPAGGDTVGDDTAGDDTAGDDRTAAPDDAEGPGAGHDRTAPDGAEGPAAAGQG